MRKALVVFVAVAALATGVGCTTSPSGEVALDPEVAQQAGAWASVAIAGVIVALLNALFGDISDLDGYY